MSDLIERQEVLKYIPSEEPLSRWALKNAPTVEAIPIEWIRNYIEKQKKALRLHDDFNDLDVIWEFIGIETLLEDWEKENGSNNKD